LKEIFSEAVGKIFFVSGWSKNRGIKFAKIGEGISRIYRYIDTTGFWEELGNFYLK